jgi:phage protein D
MNRTRHLFLTLGLVVAAAAGVGLASYRAAIAKPMQVALAKQDAMEWLRADFKLTEAQFAAIKRLHDSYAITCEEHCRAIQDAAHARATLRATGTADAAALTAADRRVEELRQIYETAIAAHVRQCAELMPPREAERYLALVLPLIKDFDHVAPPDLKLTGHHRTH